MDETTDAQGAAQIQEHPLAEEPRRESGPEETRRLFGIDVRLILLVVAGAILAGCVGFLLYENRSDIPREGIVAVVAALSALSLGSVLLSYLGAERTATIADVLFGAFLSPIRSESIAEFGISRQEIAFRAATIKALERALHQTRSRTGVGPAHEPTLKTKEEHAVVITAVLNEVRSNLGEELIQTVEQKYGPGAARASHIEALHAGGEKTRARLLNEVAALSKRSNLNLVIGIVTTAAAVALLGYIVLTSNIASPDWSVMMPGYLLRLSLVVFIEVFAFFFLRMYRVNLQDIKYFQNELTSIEAKLIAMEAALSSGDTATVSSMIAQLGNVERNHVLQQGQSTIELERLRLENGTLKELLNSASRFLPNAGVAIKQQPPS